MKFILVTGGAGYIGSHAAYVLVQKGYQVIVLDNFLHQQTVAMPWAKVIRADFADRNFLTRIFTSYPIDAVMHFAAFIEVGESVKHPQRFYDNNVTKTLVLLDTMLEHHIKKLIFSSSCAVYGAPIFMPLNEKHSTNPVSAYGRNKLIVEFALQDYAHAYGLSSISLRYFNASGATPEIGLGEQHKPETHLIPLLLRAIMTNQPFYVFGSDYDTIDGTCVRDFIHVQDIAQAHFLALKHLETTSVTQNLYINLGTETGYTVNQVIALAQEVTGKHVNVIYLDRRAGDSPVLVADASYAKKILRWEWRDLDLREIIQSAWKWEQGRESNKCNNQSEIIHENS